MPTPAPTDRLVFRKWRRDDLALALAVWGDERMSALVGGPYTDTQVRERLDSEIETEKEYGYQYWPMFATGRFVGCCGLRPRDPPNRIMEFGFYVVVTVWGQGYATEAGFAVISHAFDVLGAAALFAGHHPENVASKRTLEKLGFTYTHHELYPPTGLMHPCYELKRRD